MTKRAVFVSVFVFISLFLLLARSASAQSATTSATVKFPHNGTDYSSVAAQCAGRVSISNASNVSKNINATWTCASSIETSPYSMTFTCSGTAPGCTTSYSNASPVYTCPTGYTYNGSTNLQANCSANAPPPPPPPTCAAGTMKSYTYKLGSVQADGSTKQDYSPIEDGATDGTCEVDITAVEKCYSLPPATDAYCRYMTRTTGKTKTASEGAPAPAGSHPSGSTEKRDDVPPFESSKGSCPAGTVQGGVSISGMPMCIGTGTAPKNAPPPPPKMETAQTTQNEDGSSTTTKTTVTTNADGSKTTNIETTNTAATGEKTTTVAKDTSAAASGSPGRDDSTKDEEKYDMCKQNPMLTVCRNSTVSGSCGEVTCTGDAIQCATLRAAAAMECRDKKNEEDLAASPLVAAGNNIIGGTDTTAADFAKGTVVNMSQQNLDQSGFVTATCLANRSFSVMGQTVQVSFAQVCDSIQPLRAVVMACAFIISYLIVSRSVIQA